MSDIGLIVKNDIGNELISLSKVSLTSLNGHSLILLKEAAEAIRIAVEKVSLLEEHIKCQIDAKNEDDSVSKSTSNDRTANGPDKELRSENSLGNELEKEIPDNRSASFSRYFESSKNHVYFDVNDPKISKVKVIKAFAVHGLKPVKMKIFQKEEHSYGFIGFPNEADAARAVELSFKVNIGGEYFKIKPWKEKTAKSASPTADQCVAQEERNPCDGRDIIINVGPNIRPRRISTVPEEDFSTNIIPPLLPLEEVSGYLESGKRRAVSHDSGTPKRKRQSNRHDPNMSETADTTVMYTDGRLDATVKYINGRLDLPDIIFPKVSRKNNRKEKKNRYKNMKKKEKRLIRKKMQKKI